MAGHRRRYGRYGHRSSAQKAALRKAQLASARKRRLRSAATVVGYTVGGIVAAAAINGATKAANHPIKTSRSVKKFVGNVKTSRASRKPPPIVRTKPRSIRMYGTSGSGKRIRSRMR
jgi:hypothetical protein